MKIEYRIYTEDKGVSYEIEDMIKEYLGDYTIYITTGGYNGKTELSLVIEKIGITDDESSVRLVATKLKEIFSQTMVLITRKQVDTEII